MSSELLDLTAVTVVFDPELDRAAGALGLLLDEVERRTRVRWHYAARIDEVTGPILFAGSVASAPLEWREQLGLPAELPAEGYYLHTATSGDSQLIAVVLGNDARGRLFGIGALLRMMRMNRDRIELAASIDITSSPAVALRGHQLGYRPKTNSYDGWDVNDWEQYIRDLAVFGTNAVELIPPRSDDDADSPHFPKLPLAMMSQMSLILDRYDLDVWIWYPALDPDYTTDEAIQVAVDEWARIFGALRRIDAVFVPGGDPGHTPPGVMFRLLERQTASLRKYHPHATMWLSPQGFDQAWMSEFFSQLETQPEWLAGVVYGPQIRVSYQEFRAAVPAAVPIRLYPDITHTRQCQYPVDDWDAAFALTLGREPINPRPSAMRDIFRSTIEGSCGFLTYSEGCNDDVNKIVWSALGWDPGISLIQILSDYGRYFIGEADGAAFGEGLLALQANWRGPLLSNEGVGSTLQQFQDLERRAGPRQRRNWRFQQAQYRACYDAYIRERLIHETELERRAMERLRAAPQTGTLHAIARARDILETGVTERTATDIRARVFELAEALFQSIAMQLSVDRYAAIEVGRGANLDTIDFPLNDRVWLSSELNAVETLADEAARMQALRRIVEAKYPGPGGRYHDLGAADIRHWATETSTEHEPDLAFYHRPHVGYAPHERRSWSSFLQTLWDRPLELNFCELDRSAIYRLRIVYSGDSFQRKVSLTDGEGVEIHPFMAKPWPLRPLEFDLPQEATATGSLRLVFRLEPGAGGNGRGCQVSEVWLVRRE